MEINDKFLKSCFEPNVVFEIIQILDITEAIMKS